MILPNKLQSEFVAMFTFPYMTSVEPINKSTINLHGTSILVTGEKQNDFHQAETLLKKMDAYVIWIRNNIDIDDYINKTKFLNLKYLIIMDICEPTEDVIKKCREIKLHHKKIPVIGMIDCEQSIEKLNAIEEDFDDIIKKPLEFSEMWRAISKVITQRI